MSKIGFVSLGCPKALVDSENILTKLKRDGYQIVDSFNEANLIIVNTCGFIESAIEESLSSINEALHENGKVIVTGCLGAKGELIKEKFPKVLGVTGPHATNEVMNLVYSNLQKPEMPLIKLNQEAQVKLTPKHYAYLKISEGCNNSCTFCIIPSLRGKLQSYNIKDVLQEAEQLVKNGCKELLIISQDTGAYGVDVKYKTEFINGRPVKTKMIDLVNELSKLGIWIRLHYIYPYPHIDEVINLMRSAKILPYIDMPLQHASPKILKLMKRPANVENMLNRINAWRLICPDIAIRSTFIVGFPGETEEDFEELLNFLDVAKLDKVGCFEYSEVDGAKSNELPNLIDHKTKKQRFNRFMEKQLAISKIIGKEKIGKDLPVIIDNITKHNIIGRTKYDAPEIDGVVHIKKPSNFNKSVGDIINVKIISSNEYDLFGRVI